MTSENPGSNERESAHVDSATIEVEHADLYMTPGARAATHKLRVTLAWSLIVLFIVVIGISSAGLVFSVSQAHVNQCQRTVNTRFQQADIGRAQATREFAQAQIDLWNALLALRGTQAQKLAQFERAFADFKEKLARVTAIRYPAETGTQSCNG